MSTISLDGVVALGSITVSGNNGKVNLVDAFIDLLHFPITSVNAVLFQQHDSNTGKIYIGNTNMDIASDTGIIVVLPAPSSSSIPWFTLDIGAATDAVPLTMLAVGAALDGNKIRVSVFRT
jgi:hypothetical protein